MTSRPTYYTIRFLGRYLVAIVVSAALWSVIFALLGWTWFEVYTALIIAIGALIAIAFRPYTIEGELAAKRESGGCS